MPQVLRELQDRSNRAAPLILLVLFFGMLLPLFGWLVYSMFRIDVGTGQMAVLIHKVGKDIVNDDEVAPGLEYKGVQRVVLQEGRYFRIPTHGTGRSLTRSSFQKTSWGSRSA